MGETVEMVAVQDIPEYRQRPVRRGSKFLVDAEHVGLLTAMGWAARSHADAPIKNEVAARDEPADEAPARDEPADEAPTRRFTSAASRRSGGSFRKAARGGGE